MKSILQSPFSGLGLCGHCTSGSRGIGGGGGGGGGGASSLSAMILSPQNYLSEYSHEDALREVLRQTERKLEAQIAVASASDQRAYAFCAVVFVILAATFGFLPNDNARFLEMAALLSFTVAGVIAVFSAKPARFYDSGGTFDAFRNYLQPRNEGYLLCALIDRNNDLIKMNDKRIKSSARQFLSALFVAGIGFLFLFGNMLRFYTTSGDGGAP